MSAAELTACLEEEHRALAALGVQSEALTAALVAGRPAAIAAAVSGLGEAVAALAACRARRQEALAACARRAGLDAVPPRDPAELAAALHAAAAPEETAAWEAAWARVQAEAAAARRRAARNALLLRQALAFTAYALRRLALLLGGEGAYGPGGVAPLPVRACVVDRRA